MAKFALTVSVDQLNQHRPSPFWELTLEDRAIVDSPENTNPSCLQIIPYIALIRQSKEEGTQPWDLEILTYVRSKASGESQLHDKLSVGFGGHIDRLPTDDETLLDLVIDEALREVKEELGYSIPRKILAQAVQMELLVKKSMLHSHDLQVDRVHLGIPITIQLDWDENAPDNFTGADGECIDVKWMNLRSMSNETIEQFENWSGQIVNGLNEYLMDMETQMGGGMQNILQQMTAAGEAGVESMQAQEVGGPEAVNAPLMID